MIGFIHVLMWTTLAAAPEGAAATLSAEGIAARANIANYYAANDGRATVRLLIVDAQGRKTRRQFDIVRRDERDGGAQQFFVRFERPADVRGTTFLVLKKPDSNDDRWLYLPALDLVKRIAASDERTSFVGSHIYYEDVSGRSPKEDIHKLTKETPSHWILESTPRKASSVEFARYTVKIRKKDGLPERIDYFDRKGRALRRIEAARVEVVDGHPTISRMKVSDLRNGGYTLAAFSSIKYNIGVSDSLFVERSLRNPPLKWLKAR